MLATTTTTVVVGGKQTKKKSKKRQRAGKRAMRLMVRLAGRDLEKQDSPEGREKGLDLAIADPAGGFRPNRNRQHSNSPYLSVTLCPFSACDSMLLVACTTSNAAFREVGCKAANGSGEGRRDIRRVCPAASHCIRTTKLMIFLEIQRCDCGHCSNHQMSGKFRNSWPAMCTN